jgi:hypothetical protein
MSVIIITIHTGIVVGLDVLRAQAYRRMNSSYFIKERNYLAVTTLLFMFSKD